MSLLKAKREAAGLTVSEAARRANMEMTKLWKIEHGDLQLKVKDVARLARAIGCTPGELIPPLDEEESETSEPSPLLGNERTEMGGMPAPDMAITERELLIDLDQAITKALMTFHAEFMPLAKAWPEENRKKVADRLRLVSYAWQTVIDEIVPMLAKREPKP